MASVELVPDAGLARALSKALSGGEITIQTLKQLRNLDAADQNISNLTGLEYCTNLEGLSLQDNNITDVGPLSALVCLESLSLNHNPVADMAAAGSLPELRKLYIGATKVSSLSFVTNFPRLELLSCVFSQVTSLIDLHLAVFLTKNNKKLQQILAYGNKLDIASSAYAQALRNAGIEVHI
jgi:internalin A